MTNGQKYQGKFVNRDGLQMRFRCAQSFGQHYFEREVDGADEPQHLSVSICKTDKGAVVMRRSRYNDGEAPTMRKFWLFESMDGAVGALDKSVAGEAAYAEGLAAHVAAADAAAKAQAEQDSIPEV